MNVNVHRHNYWLQSYDCDAASRIRGMRSKRETDFHRLLLTAASTRRTVRGTRCTLTFHSTGLVSYQSHDTISRWSTANNDHILSVIHLHSRHLSLKKKYFSQWHPLVLHCGKSPSKLNTYLLTYSKGQSPSWEANGLQQVKKFPEFYGTQRFIATFTSARHLSQSWASSIQSIPPHPTSWRSI